MKRMIDIECSECDHKELDVWREYREYGTCPKCESPMLRLMQSFGGAHGDDIPGGVLMPHAICNDDGTPKRYYSHSEIRKAAAAKGWSNRVEHIPERGSDRSKHTTRWI